MDAMYSGAGIDFEFLNHGKLIPYFRGEFYQSVDKQPFGQAVQKR